MVYRNSLFNSDNQEQQEGGASVKLSQFAQTSTEQERQKGEAAERVRQKLGGYSYNPYLKSDGSLVNPYLPYQKILDNPSTSSVAKDWITAATGLTATAKSTAAENSETSSQAKSTAAENSGASSQNNSYNSNVSGLTSEQLSKMDIASELPKLSEAQISKIIDNHFSKSSVISSSDAAGIKAAQDKTGMSALAILGIGALESGYGTSQIANNTGNLWGYGATNDNPEGNARKYGQVATGASQYATEFMNDYYNGYGAKTIYAAGTGDNPSGKGYAYFDNGTINSGWSNDVSSIMATFCNTLTNSGLSGNTNGLASSSSKGQQLVETAKKYLGTKYVWGGESPDGFDCSGLMQYVCAENGIDVSRTTYTQINDGKAVAKSELQPGDFILFGTKDDPHHIGMYVGNGQYIHAPRTGDVVKISNLSDRSDYLTARRVV